MESKSLVVDRKFVTRRHASMAAMQRDNWQSFDREAHEDFALPKAEVVDKPLADVLRAWASYCT